MPYFEQLVTNFDKTFLRGLRGTAVTDYTVAYLKTRYKRVTTAMMMDASGVPRDDWGGEHIAELPRQMQK